MSQSATPATQNDMTICLETFEKERFRSFPRDTATPQERARLETRHVGTPKRAFRARLLPIFTLCSFKIDVFLRVFVGTSKFGNLKIDVSCEASVNFQHMSQNATPATESATWRHLTQPCQCDLQKTRDTTRLKCCASHAEWRWTRPKCCACHENCKASSENVAKVLCLPHQTTFDTLQNTSKCHKVPRLPRETKQRKETSRNVTSCRTYHRHGHTVLTRTVADGCERERNVQRTHPQPPDPQSETGTLATHSGKIQIFHQMTKKMTNKMTILQVSKIAFFSKHCHLFSVSFIFRQIFDIFPFFVRQWHQNDKKKIQIFHQMTKKKDKTNDNCAGCKNCIFLEALSFFCHFCHFSHNWRYFPYFLKMAPKWQKMSNKIHQMTTKKAFFWKHCHFFVIFCHFSNNFRYFSMFLRKWHQNDQNMTKFPPNDKKWQKMTGQNWNKKTLQKCDKKWQTKLKWQKKQNKWPKKWRTKLKWQKHAKKNKNRQNMTK